jgi:tetratricopeptide (TPR) repeat protein
MPSFPRLRGLLRPLSVLLLLAAGPAAGQAVDGAPPAAEEVVDSARLRALHDQILAELDRLTAGQDAGGRLAAVMRVVGVADWIAIALLASLGGGLLAGYGRVRRLAGRARKDAEKSAEWAAQSWLRSYGPEEVERVLSLRTGKEIERIRWHVDEALERLRRQEETIGRRVAAERLSEGEERAVTALLRARATAGAAPSADAATVEVLRAGAGRAAGAEAASRSVGDWLVIGAEALAAGRPAAVVEAFGRALRCSGGSALDYARATAGLGHAHVAAGRWEEAARAFERAEAHVRDLAGEEERSIGAASLFNGADALRRLGRTVEAARALDALVDRFADDTSPSVRTLIADAMIGRAVVVAETEGPAAAIAHYDGVVRRFGDDPAFADGVAEALVNKGIDLAEAQGPAAAMAVYEDVVRRFGETLAPSLHEHVVRALLNKGVAVADVEGPAAALAIFDEVIRRCGDGDAPGPREILARALVNRGLMVALVDGAAAAAAVYDDVIEWFGDDLVAPIREQVANAYVNKGVMVARLLGPAAAVAVCDEMIRRFGRDPDPALREQVAKTLFNKAANVARTDGPAAAAILYEELIFRFGADASARMQEIVVAARGARDHLRGAHGTSAAA